MCTRQRITRTRAAVCSRVAITYLAPWGRSANQREFISNSLSNRLLVVHCSVLQLLASVKQPKKRLSPAPSVGSVCSILEMENTKNAFIDRLRLAMKK